MSKQDGYSSRTAVDLERKYNFGKTFAEVYGLISDAQRAAQEAKNAFDGLTHEQIFNLLTNYGEWQGIYRDDNGDVYVNASFIKGGTIKGDYVQVEAATITGQLVATQIDTKDLKVLAANITGTLTAGQIDTTNLKVSAANVSGKLTASQIDTTYLFVNAANITGVLSADHIDTDSLTVDAANITGDLVAGSLIGSDVALLTSASRTAGGLSITGATTSTYAIELYSNGALRLEAYNGAAYLGSGDAYVHVEEGGTTINNGTVGIDLDTHIWMGGNVFPVRDEVYMCGNSNYTWSDVWAVNVTQTSDRNKKKDISYDLSGYDLFFDGLKPSIYRFKNGTSGRKHPGFVAQDIKDNLAEHGIPTSDFAGYVEDVDEDGNPTYGLRYSEFIPLIVEQVQKLKARVAELEGNKHGQKA